MNDRPNSDAGAAAAGDSARFDLGEVYTDQRAREALDLAGLTTAAFLARHERGDYGLASGRTVARNVITLARGRGLIASLYELPSGQRLSVHTHASSRMTDIRLRAADWGDDVPAGDITPAMPGTSRHLFELGKLVATNGALDAIRVARTSVLELVVRHVTGDWGDLDEHDKAENRSALDHGERVVSVYQLTPSIRIYVITERDRSRTTLLLPSEY